MQKSGCNGFTDGEIYGQAVHYYDENEIEVGKPMNCQVVVNHFVAVSYTHLSRCILVRVKFLLLVTNATYWSQ